MRIKKSMSLDSSEKKTSNPTLERLEVPKASSQDSVTRGQTNLVVPCSAEGELKAIKPNEVSRQPTTLKFVLCKVRASAAAPEAAPLGNLSMDMLNNAKDEMALRLFGRSRTIALAGNQCVKCGEFGNEFRDALSRKEFGISGLCQDCQDGIFGVGE
jgi:hypothetical protein|tara:strand:- start:436 stop:906 length:471 start_codon:yes stop_codon:yes gene_type:complete